MHTSTWPTNSGASYEVGVYDVNTTLAQLGAYQAGVAAYTDLGSGSLYASAVFADGDTLILNLSAQAVIDINAHLGSDFRVGFTNITLNGTNPNGVGVGLYTNDSLDAPVGPRLILNNTPIVPLPSAAWLFSSGILAIGSAIRRRR